MKKIKKITQENKAFLSLSGKSTAGWGGFILFSFILIFITGTLVGRGTIKIDLGQKNLAKEINHYADLLDNIKKDQLEIIDDKPDLLFYESLQKKEKPKEKINNKKKEADKKNIIPVKVKKIIKRQKAVNKPVKEIPKELLTKTFNKNTDIFKYSIQVASFKSFDDAKKAVVHFKQKNYPAYYVKALVRNNEVWYRVRIGEFKDRIDAKSTLLQLEKNNIDGFLVTR